MSAVIDITNSRTDGLTETFGYVLLKFRLEPDRSDILKHIEDLALKHKTEIYKKEFTFGKEDNAIKYVRLYIHNSTTLPLEVCLFLNKKTCGLVELKEIAKHVVYGRLNFKSLGFMNILCQTKNFHESRRRLSYIEKEIEKKNFVCFYAYSPWGDYDEVGFWAPEEYKDILLKIKLQV